MMSRGPQTQNEINYHSREMQKVYYDQQAYSGYFHHNGYAYDNPYVQASNDYRAQCLLQQTTALNSPSSGNSQEFPTSYSTSCMQDNPQRSPPCSVVGPASSPGSDGGGSTPGSAPTKPAEIYPWMRESRQNSKRQLAQLSGMINGVFKMEGPLLMGRVRTRLWRKGLPKLTSVINFPMTEATSTHFFNSNTKYTHFFAMKCNYTVQRLPVRMGNKLPNN